MKLPLRIKKLLKNYSLVTERVSRVGGTNLKYEHKNGEVLYLKVGKGIAAQGLAKEVYALELLKKSSLSVPKVVSYSFSKPSGKAYLLMTAIPGLPMYKYAPSLWKEKLQLTAEALKELNSITVTQTQELQSLDKDIQFIAKIIKFELIKRDDFVASNNGKSPEEILVYLNRMKSKFERSYLVHGDYCLPNVLIHNKSYGFIDLGDLGCGDMYKDLSALEVSIKRNLGHSWIDTFYELYNPEFKREEWKIKYFQFIDQFAYHLDIDKYNLLYQDTKKLFTSDLK